MNYPLYHTLNAERPKGKFSDVNRKKLIDLTKTDLSEQKKTAILMLVAEHARINDKYNFVTDDLPYRMKQTGEDVIMYVEKFPTELQWILWKFLQIK